MLNIPNKLFTITRCVSVTLIFNNEKKIAYRKYGTNIVVKPCLKDASCTKKLADNFLNSKKELKNRRIVATICPG